MSLLGRSEAVAYRPEEASLFPQLAASGRELT